MIRTPREQRADAIHRDLHQLILLLEPLLGNKNKPLRRPIHHRIRELTDTICKLAPLSYARYRVPSASNQSPDREARRKRNREWWAAAQRAALRGDFAEVDRLCDEKAKWGKKK